MTAPALTHIFIDESGTLYDPSEAVVTVVALSTRDPSALQWIVRRVRRDVRNKSSAHRPPSEFKFYNTTSQVRGRMLAELAKTDVMIYALSTHKGRQRIQDTPEHFAILLSALLEECVPADAVVALSIDRHFSQAAKQARLVDLVCRALNASLDLKFVDSRSNSFVQLADFAAGAIKYAHTGRTTIYREFLRSRIVMDELRVWKDLKSEWLGRVRGK